jgi:arginine exporter protein ArgO
LGFLWTLAMLVSIGLFPELSLLMFSQWYTAIAEVLGLVLLCYIAVKHYEKHHRAERYDDRVWEVNR